MNKRMCMGKVSTGAILRVSLSVSNLFLCTVCVCERELRKTKWALWHEQISSRPVALELINPFVPSHLIASSCLECLQRTPANFGWPYGSCAWQYWEQLWVIVMLTSEGGNEASFYCEWDGLHMFEINMPPSVTNALSVWCRLLSKPMSSAMSTCHSRRLHSYLTFLSAIGEDMLKTARQKGEMAAGAPNACVVAWSSRTGLVWGRLHNTSLI